MSAPSFSFEILPPLKGNDIRKVFAIIDRLIEFQPQYINITTHHSERIERPNPGSGEAQTYHLRKRPGTVAIAAAIQYKYGVPAVPHIICKGFTKEETEYALIDLNFLGVHNLLLLQGDAKKLTTDRLQGDCNNYATDLQAQINDFNNGQSFDGSTFEPYSTPFRYGMACYPEKHFAAPSLEQDMHFMKMKQDMGAKYFVTQMFFDNQKYFAFVEKARAAGITVPIVPGIKPIVLLSQREVLPPIFAIEYPEALKKELQRCKSDADATEVGVEWCIDQCRQLLAADVPGLHFYSFLASESVHRIAKHIY